MKASIVILLSIIFTFSCSKFEHSDLDLGSSCELCDWAEDREGTYTGLMYGNAAGGTAGTPVSFEVEQVFLNQSTVDDSIRMYFRVIETWQNSGAVYQWTGSALDSSGGISGANDYNFKMRGDSIQVSRTYYGPGFTPFSAYGTFYR